MAPRRGSILIVDDGQAQLEALVELLESEGYHVRGASTFGTAKALLESEVPDLLISDVRLGAFNGLHLWLRVHTQHPSVAGLIITGYPDPFIEEEARRHGAAFLSKPLRRADFIRTVTTLVTTRTQERRRSLRKRPPFPIPARVQQGPVTVVDVSYGGLRFQLTEATALGEEFAVELFDPPMSLKVKQVWRQESACGTLIVTEVNPFSTQAEQVSSWRALVDSLTVDPVC